MSSGSALAKACGCNDNWNPVCWNSKTYQNMCQATCVNEGPLPAGDFEMGRCEGTYYDGPDGDNVAAPPDTCSKCPDTRFPVCADRQTFDNSCYSYCHGYLVATSGMCANQRSEVLESLPPPFVITPRRLPPLRKMTDIPTEPPMDDDAPLTDPVTGRCPPTHFLNRRTGRCVKKYVHTPRLTVRPLPGGKCPPGTRQAPCALCAPGHKCPPCGMCRRL